MEVILPEFLITSVYFWDPSRKNLISPATGLLSCACFIRRCSVSLTRRNSIDGITAFIPPKKFETARDIAYATQPCMLNLLPNPIHTLVPAEFFFLFPTNPPIRFFVLPACKGNSYFIYLSTGPSKCD